MTQLKNLEKNKNKINPNLADSKELKKTIKIQSRSYWNRNKDNKKSMLQNLVLCKAKQDRHAFGSSDQK